MIKVSNFLYAGLLMTALVLTAPVLWLSAQSLPEAAVTISVANVGEQLDDVAYLMEAAGFADFKFPVQTMIKQYTKGIDAESPMGVLLFFKEDTEIPDVLGFITVSDMEKFLDVLSSVAEIDEGDEYITIFLEDGTELIFKEANGSVFFSMNEEMLEDLPSNPNSLLGDMPQKYNLAARVKAQQIPESLRNLAIDQIKDAYESQMDLLDDEGSFQSELQRKNFEISMKQMTRLFNESDSLEFGIVADQETERLYMDVDFTALPGSELAKQMAASRASDASMFTGFLMDGAALTFNTRVDIYQNEIATYRQLIEQATDAIADGLAEETDLDEEKLEQADEYIDRLAKIIIDTFEAGKIDSGAVLMLEDGNLNLAAGLQIANPQEFEALFKELIELAQAESSEEFEVNLNSGSHKDVTFHEILVPIPDDEEEARNLFGDEVSLIVGIGQKAIYLGAGSNPMPVLKSAMDGKSTTGDELAQYNLFLTPILKFAAGLADEPIVEKLASELESNGKDRIRVSSQLIENGSHTRFEMQDGILALIKVGFDEAMSGGGFGGADF